MKDSLAGRAAYTTTWPLARREQLGLGTAGIMLEDGITNVLTPD